LSNASPLGPSENAGDRDDDLRQFNEDPSSGTPNESDQRILSAPAQRLNLSVVDTTVKRPNNGKAVAERRSQVRVPTHKNVGELLRQSPSLEPIMHSREPIAMAPKPLDHGTLRETLEAAGLRCTPQRLAVYDELRRAELHPTAEDVFQAVRGRIPKISLATVYKALETLVAVGAAYKLTTGDGTQAARYDARRDHHYHFRCLRTGAVHDLPTRFDPELISKLDPELPGYLDHQGFRLTGYRLELLGYRNGPHNSEQAPIEAGENWGAEGEASG
jgi:Fe2+ or Zn2+ uptake regulation protein